MVLDRIKEIVGEGNVFTDKVHRISYSYDASMDKGEPDYVVFPSNEKEVVELVELFNENKTPFLARGAGTCYSGGSVPMYGGAVIQLSGMNRIINVDYDNETILVETGIINERVNQFLKQNRYRFIPDPASKDVCTIGGNVAENAGGPYCLAYGVTQNYVLGLEIITPTGEILYLENEAVVGLPNLKNLFIGSEGTLGIITKIKLKISKMPEKKGALKVIFSNNEDASCAVRDIINNGIIPAALEMVTDPVMPGFEDLNENIAVLLIDVEGKKEEEIESKLQNIKDICNGNKGTSETLNNEMHLERGALLGEKIKEVNQITGKNKRFLVDGVVPRCKLPEAMKIIEEISYRKNLPVINIFHAGDGNIHPSIFYNVESKDEKKKVEDFVDEIMNMCLELGGSLTGEHGIGFEKMRHIDMAFSSQEREFFRRIKNTFDKNNICNPGKAI